MHNAPILHGKVGTRGRITGSYVGGFVVYVPKERKTLHLPFSNIDGWYVVGSPRRRK
jgi:hypothetical protein